MNHQSTLARPYAKALFELAQQQNKLDFWSKVLQLLAKIVTDPIIIQYYARPHSAREALIETIYQILKTANYATSEVKNLLLLLNEYRRLLILPAIADLFTEAKIHHEKTLSLTVTAAFAIPENLKTRLRQSLEKRLQCVVKVDYAVDADLLGGMVIRSGDLVIDGSVKSQLVKLKHLVIRE